MGISQSAVDPTPHVNHILGTLLLVLPVVGRLSKRLAEDVVEWDKRKAHLRSIHSSIFVLVDSLIEIERDGRTQLLAAEIFRLADCLEAIFSDRHVKSTGTKYPRLVAVSELAAASDNWQPKPEYLLDTSALKNEAAWRRLQLDLNGVTDDFQRYEEHLNQPEFATARARHQPPDDQMYTFVNRAFDAIRCRCHAKSERELGMKLGTYRWRKPKHGSSPFCTFLTRDDASEEWREVRLHSQPQENESSCSTEVSNKADSTHSHNTHGAASNCICDYLQTYSSSRLRLDITLGENSLRRSDAMPGKRQLDPRSLVEQIDLKTLLSSDRQHWTQQSNWVLAVILAYSLLYLHGRPKTMGQWMPHNIFFFQDRYRIPLRPFFQADVPIGIARRSTGLGTHHPNLQILELGVLLLEIHIGKGLESYLNLSEQISDGDMLYWKACEVYSMEEPRFKFHMSTRFQDAVKACLTPATFAKAVRNVPQLRSTLFETVVKPLEEDLAEIVPEILESDDLDEEAAKKYDLGGLMDFANPRPRTTRHIMQYQQNGAQPDGHVTSYPKDYSHTKHFTERNFTTRGLASRLKYKQSLSSKMDNIVENSLDPDAFALNRQKSDGSDANTTLFETRRDTEIPIHISAAHGDYSMPNTIPDANDNTAILLAATNAGNSSAWLKKFDQANSHLRSLVKTKCEPIKIAILDTGCDLEDGFFAGPGINYIDDLQERWLDLADTSPLPVDDDSKKHGTALTALLLRLIPEAVIYAIRVAKSSEGLAAAAGGIATAITHAAGEWDVDIVSMSFGFTRKVKAIEDAILNAERIREDKILFFAAANNDGLNEPEMFPAHLGSVISVRGTRHDGFFEQLYNPSAWFQNRGYHYGTLAVDVPWRWTDLRLTKSGCSVATPIMVAIAAAIISFVAGEDSLHHHNDLIRTRLGILSVFEEMSSHQDSLPNRRFLAPWQLYQNSRAPSEVIAYALGNLPQ